MADEQSIQELVEVRAPKSTSGALWQPCLGREVLGLIDTQTNLSDAEKSTLQGESLSILARCWPPNAPDSCHSGLIVGSIQSGKTLSFTTVAALARDNCFRIIVVITGTVNILNSQSVKRLMTMLRIHNRSDYAWRLIRSPRDNSSLAREIQDLLQDWEAGNGRGFQPRTILITLLKNRTQLESLANLLGRLKLSGVPSLVIDDEADQAGLNTAVKKDDESATYRALQDVRNSLPHHTYLGYTATPQAPLLINIMDASSAKFARVLTAGADYVGGEELFDHKPSLIRVIPDHEVPSKDNPLNSPPVSLLKAMRSFFVAVAAGIFECVVNGFGASTRSMLIHPSVLTAQHATYVGWVQTIMASWSRLLDGDASSDTHDREALISSFESAHSDLEQTAPQIPSFEELKPYLPQAVRRTVIQEINARLNNPFPDIDDIDEFWGSSYSFILVGGQSIERGFTVEGLTTTYMSRGIGTGLADSIQQRGRFFGYSRNYLGYCRVYLESEARHAFRSYIDHEDRLRQSLIEHGTTDRPLSDWRRIFYLDSSLKPTRDAVLDIPYSRGPAPLVPYGAMPPLDFPDDLEDNRQTIEQITRGLSFNLDEGDSRRTAAQRHEVAAGVSARFILDQLLVPLKISEPNDSWLFQQIRILTQRHLETKPKAFCTVYRMRPGFTEFERKLMKGGRIEPFQGKNEPTGYPGDRKIFDPENLTVQLYEYSRILNREGKVLGEKVPQVVVVLPRHIALGLIVQDQGI